MSEAAGSDPGPHPGPAAPGGEPHSCPPATHIREGPTGPEPPRWQCRQCPLPPDRSTATASRCEREEGFERERNANSGAGDETPLRNRHHAKRVAYITPRPFHRFTDEETEPRAQISVPQTCGTWVPVLCRLVPAQSIHSAFPTSQGPVHTAAPAPR